MYLIPSSSLPKQIVNPVGIEVNTSTCSRSMPVYLIYRVSSVAGLLVILPVSDMELALIIVTLV